MSKLDFLVPIFAVPIFLILGIFENQIKTNIGDLGFKIILYSAVGIILILITIHIINLFIKMSDGSYNYFFGGGKRAKRIQKEGIKAYAKLLEIGENSKGGILTINDQPVLNLTLEIFQKDNPSYNISFDNIVPRYLIPQLQPGNEFSVRIDPEDNKFIVLDNNREHYMQIGKKMSSITMSEIQDHGINGKATIINIEDTKKSKDFLVVIIIHYKIFPENNSPYTYSIETALNTKEIDQIKDKLDKTFKCKIHPKDKNKFIVNW